MRKLRNALLVATGVVFGACATQTFRPEAAPEYVVTRDPTPFYLSKPRQESTPDAALSAQTRVKLLRKQASYSLVLLEDLRKGYVANAYLTQAPSEAEPSPRPKRRAAPSPTPAPSQPETPASDASAPAASTPASPDSQAPPEGVPSPTPAPEAPLEKPKFRL